MSDNAAKILAIKHSAEYLKLKNKVRSDHENKQYQRLLRDIAVLENQNKPAQAPSVVKRTAPKQPPPVVKKPAKLNQPKPIAWRNQNAGKVASDVRDPKYEREYAERLAKFKATGKFAGNLMTPPKPKPNTVQLSDDEPQEDNFGDNIEEVNNMEYEDDLEDLPVFG